MDRAAAAATMHSQKRLEAIYQFVDGLASMDSKTSVETTSVWQLIKNDVQGQELYVLLFGLIHFKLRFVKLIRS